MNVRFMYAEGQRVKISNAQQKEIRAMYQSLANIASQRAEKLMLFGTNVSDQMRAAYLQDLKKQLEAEINAISTQLELKLKKNIGEVSLAVVEDAQGWIDKVGLGIDHAYSYVPTDVVQSIMSGKLYKGSWTYSSAIWRDAENVSREMDKIVAIGIASNKSTYEIAKDLEKFVDPSARKPWDWSKVYPGTRRVIDYNAQRLARTLVSHAYQESFVRATKNNPFFEAYQWLSSGSDRMCSICAERDGKIFPKDGLPLDHPNGMCTFVVVQEKSMKEVASDLRNWAHGTGDKKLNSKIDKFIKDAKGIRYKGSKSDRLKPQSLITPRSIPEIKTWIDKARRQTESHMLELEGDLEQVLGYEGKRGLQVYTGSSYQEMNSYLRYIGSGLDEATAVSKSGISQSQLNHLQNAKKALDSVKTPENLVLRRGTDVGDLAGLLPGDFSKNKSELMWLSSEELNEKLQGVIGVMDGFTSTSSMWDRGFSGDVEMLFYAPEGTSASSIMSISQYGTGEGETLLNAGTKVKILKIEESDGHKGSNIRVFLEILLE